jgi:hypothetical protein
MISIQCSKHVERWNNKYTEKIASSWILTRIISRCTVNYTLNFRVSCRAYHWMVTGWSTVFCMSLVWIKPYNPKHVSTDSCVSCLIHLLHCYQRRLSLSVHENRSTNNLERDELRKVLGLRYNKPINTDCSVIQHAKLWETCAQIPSNPAC